MKRVFGLRANRRFALGHQLLEGDAARLGGGAAREERQLQPALVVEVVRREERLRLGGVDEHRDVEARRRLPDRIELGVVDLQARAVRLLDAQAERLGDLADADRAGGDVGLELLHGALGPARPDLAEVDAAQDAEAILVRAGGDGVERRLEPRAGQVCRR